MHLDGGMTEELVVPQELVFRCEAGMTADQAALVEPTAVALHACRRAGLSPGMNMAVIGSGVIGMLAIQIARSWGCEPILAIDRIPERLILAERMGAQHTVSEQIVERGRELCPDGFDVVMDMVGIEQTLSDAAVLARRGGVIVPVALPHGSVQYDFEPLYRKELTLAGSRLYNGDFDRALTMIAAGEVDPDPIVTHHFSLREASEAFSVLRERPEEAIKVIVVPN